MYKKGGIMVESLKQQLLTAAQEVEQAIPGFAAYSSDVTELAELQARQVAGLEEVISMFGAVIEKVVEVAEIGEQAKQKGAEMHRRDIDTTAEGLKNRVSNVLADAESPLAGHAWDSITDVHNSADNATYILSRIEGRIDGSVADVAGLQRTVEFVQQQAAVMKSQMQDIGKEIGKAGQDAEVVVSHSSQTTTTLRTYSESL